MATKQRKRRDGHVPAKGQQDVTKAAQPKRKKRKAKAPKPNGRPSDYRPRFCKKAQEMAHGGATDREIAEKLGVHEVTLYRWQHEHPEFRSAIKLGKEAADKRVEQSLYRRAIGYSHDATKIMQNNGVPVIVPYVEHFPPDPTSMIFWLKNRKPKDWRDKIDHEHAGANGGPIELTAIRLVPLGRE
jgi:transposase-like protein